MARRNQNRETVHVGKVEPPKQTRRSQRADRVAPRALRPEADHGHIARDVAEGRFPGKSEKKMVADEQLRHAVSEPLLDLGAPEVDDAPAPLPPPPKARKSSRRTARAKKE